MCIDNPREGFSNIFDTHPSIDARVAALVKFAGGHDPGPPALPQPDQGQADIQADAQREDASAGPWGSSPSSGPTEQGSQGGDRPFLPSRPPIDLAGPSSPAGGDAGGDVGSDVGPWGPHRR
jgi:heat shock protein HtpX